MNHRFLLKLSGFALMACYAASILAGAGARPNVPPSPAPDTPAVKVGVLHSLTGTMAISEVTVKNATMLAIDQLNASGGALGKQVEPVIEDGASDPAIFSQKAQKLIQQDKAAKRCCRCSNASTLCCGIPYSSRVTNAPPTLCTPVHNQISKLCRR